MATLVTVAIYDEPSQAAVARSYLDAHGMVAILPEWHQGWLLWHQIYPLHGLRLWTLDTMAEDARELLATATLGRDTPSTKAGMGWVRPDINPVDLTIAAAAFWLSGLPFPIWKRRWYRRYLRQDE